MSTTVKAERRLHPMLGGPLYGNQEIGKSYGLEHASQYQLTFLGLASRVFGLCAFYIDSAVQFRVLSDYALFVYCLFSQNADPSEGQDHQC